MQREWPLTKEEFSAIYAKVPRLTVEVLVTGPKGLYLTQRNIEPCLGQWHLPGGTVYFGEYLLDTVKRIAQKEIGITVKAAKMVGHIEYPSHFLANIDHPFGVVFEVTEFTGELTIDSAAKQGGWFAELPTPMHADQDDFLRSHGYSS